MQPHGGTIFVHVPYADCAIAATGYEHVTCGAVGEGEGGGGEGVDVAGVGGVVAGGGGGDDGGGSRGRRRGIGTKRGVEGLEEGENE